MTTTAIREKLYDYIRIADDKKIEAIYAMLEDTVGDDVQWWKDPLVTNELDTRLHDFNSGKDKGHSFAEIESSITMLRQKRDSK